MTFAEPAYLWVLAAPASLVILVFLRHRARLDQQKRLASPAVWRRLMGGAPSTGLARLLAWCVAMACVSLALARPQWGEIPSEVSVRTRDLVLAIDVSDSMRCPDVRPDRLSWAMEIVTRALPALEGNRVGVVVFAGEAYSLIPLTIDLQAAASFLEGVTPGMVGLPGSNLEAAVAAAARLLPADGEGRVVAILSDGENLQGDPEVAAKALKEAGASLLGVVVGTERGGPIPVHDEAGGVHYKRTQEGQPVVTRADPGVLRRMVDTVAGDVVIADGPDPERRLIEAVEGLRTREIETNTTPRRVERFPVFLAMGAMALVFGFVLSPWRKVGGTLAFLLALALPLGAQQQAASPPHQMNQHPGAEEPSSAEPGAEQQATLDIPWWQRLIPGGDRRLARRGAGQWQKEQIPESVESFAGAATLAPENPVRLYDLGTALAGAGAGEQALPILEAAERGGVEGAAFNAGTAALTSGQAEAAVETLRRALLADPADPAVKRNYELALQLLEQQEQEQQEQENDDQEQDQDEQQEEEQEQQQDQEQQDQEQQPEPTPTPSPENGEQQPQPTPTPDPNGGIYAALDRAEAEAREDMKSPTPQPGTVEKDW